MRKAQGEAAGSLPTVSFMGSSGSITHPGLLVSEEEEVELGEAVLGELILKMLLHEAGSQGGG